MRKEYLRELKIGRGNFIETTIDIFEGDIKKDKGYWKTFHNGTVRYFELKEVK